MSGHDIFVAVAAIVTAFHNGAELATRIKPRHHPGDDDKDSRDEFESERRMLQVSLQTAETQVAYHYAAMNQMRDIVRVGDALARDRLHHVIVVIQTDIIAGLQLAVDYQSAVVDLPALHEAAITNRKTTIEALDELKQRVLFAQPSPPLHQRSASPSPRISRDSRGSIISVLPSQSPPPGDQDAILVSNPAGEHALDRIRSFSAHRKERESVGSLGKIKSRTSTSSQNADFHPALNFLLQSKSPEERTAIMEEIDELILAYQNLNFNYDRGSTIAMLNGHTRANKRDTLAMLMGMDGGDGDRTALDNAAMQMLRSPTRDEKDREHIFPSSHRTNGAPSSDHANEPDSVPSLRRWSNSSSVYSDHTIMSSDPPSLYRYGSGSSRGSDAHPAEPPSPPRQHFQRPTSFQQHTGTGVLDTSRHLHTPKATTTTLLPTPPGSARPDSLAVAPLAVRSRPTTPTTPTNALKAADDKPLPPIPWNQQRLDEGENLGQRGNGNGQYHHQHQHQNHLMPSNTLHRPTPHHNHHHHNSQSRPHTPTSHSTLHNLLPKTPHLKNPLHIANTSLLKSSSRSTTPLPTSTPHHHQHQHQPQSILPTPTPALLPANTTPSKENNYLGYCKGAWTIRASPLSATNPIPKGLALETRPTGMYSTTTILQCRACEFEGATYSLPPSSKKNPLKKEKEVITPDPRIHKSSTGIRYRWLFLAKSHVKQLHPTPVVKLNNGVNAGGADVGVTAYGCLLCTGLGVVTGVYGNVEMLMNHIFMEHARGGRVGNTEGGIGGGGGGGGGGGINDKLLKEVNCIWGRVAGKDEEWDLNVSNEDTCVVLF
ncbi:unnamed protein product [Periconia digitata]|uniref:Uncharacterized protein n=1 Tax=Periconia digitata TaxID=1303443 RepID=A0A9W4XWC1_9PLEO|nr:unnamed protein product [Periconia digitata]